MSVTASPALITASCAAATNERPAGNRRNSEVCDKNTRRGGGSLDIPTASQHLANPKRQIHRRTICAVVRHRPELHARLRGELAGEHVEPPMA